MGENNLDTDFIAEIEATADILYERGWRTHVNLEHGRIFAVNENTRESLEINSRAYVMGLLQDMIDDSIYRGVSLNKYILWRIEYDSMNADEDDQDDTDTLTEAI
jgi:hypothetical protein